jgi:hypothetical protein
VDANPRVDATPWHWRRTDRNQVRQRFVLFVPGFVWIGLNDFVFRIRGDFLHWRIGFPGVLAVLFALLPDDMGSGD